MVLEAAQGRLPLTARRDIREEWDAKVEVLRKSLGELTGMADIALVPNFHANADKLRASSEDRSEEADKRHVESVMASLGYQTYMYFDKLREYLHAQGFEGDAMLQEGFQEAVSAKTVGLRVVEKLERKDWNEIVIERGILWMQCMAKGWAIKQDTIADGLLQML